MNKNLKTLFCITSAMGFIAHSESLLAQHTSIIRLISGLIEASVGIAIVLIVVYWNGYNKGKKEHVGNPKPISDLPKDRRTFRLRGVISCVNTMILTLEFAEGGVLLVRVPIEGDLTPSWFTIGHWYHVDDYFSFRPLPVGKLERMKHSEFD